MPRVWRQNFIQIRSRIATGDSGWLLARVCNGRFHTAAPDLVDLGGDYAVGDTVLDQEEAGLVFLVTVDRVSLDDSKKESHRFRIAAADFKIMSSHHSSMVVEESL